MSILMLWDAFHACFTCNTRNGHTIYSMLYTYIPLYLVWLWVFRITNKHFAHTQRQPSHTPLNIACTQKRGLSPLHICKALALVTQGHNLPYVIRKGNCHCRDGECIGYSAPKQLVIFFACHGLGSLLLLLLFTW